MVDHANTFLLLQIGNAPAESFHFGPMDFWAEMMLGVIAIVKEKPVIDLAVAAHAPRNRFVGIRAVVPEIAVQITEAVTEIKKWQEVENDVAPVEQKHDEERSGESGQFDISPREIAIAALAQFFANRANIIAKETQKNVAPRVFRFAVVAMFVDRDPIDGLTVFVGSISIALVMLHVDSVVVRL